MSLTTEQVNELLAELNHLSASTDKLAIQQLAFSHVIFLINQKLVENNTEQSK